MLTRGTFVGFLGISAWDFSLCWLLHVPSSPAFSRHVLTKLKLASSVCIMSSPTSTCFLRLLYFFFIFVLRLFQLHFQFLLFPVDFPVVEVFHFVFATWGFPFVSPFCLKFSCCLSLPFCVSLLFSCILLRVFHFLFLLVDFFRHTRVFVSCMLIVSHKECCFILVTWNIVFSFMHAYCVSQGMLFHFGDLEYCFTLCMFGCLWIFFLLLFTNINIFYFVCGFSSHEFLFHACLLCLTRNVVSFWWPGILLHFVHVWLLMDFFLLLFICCSQTSKFFALFVAILLVFCSVFGPVVVQCLTEEYTR